MLTVRPGRRAEASAPAPLILGLGNEHRGDDAFGILVARRLSPRLVGVADVLERDVEGTELLDLWAGRDRVWVVDAVRTGGAPGTVYRIEVGAGSLPTRLSETSSHGISLGQAVALGQVLDRLPRHLVIHGAEPSSFDVGASLSTPVARAVETVARRIEEEVSGNGVPGRTPPSRGSSDA